MLVTRHTHLDLTVYIINIWGNILYLVYEQVFERELACNLVMMTCIVTLLIIFLY